MYSRRPAALTRPEAEIRYGRRPQAGQIRPLLVKKMPSCVFGPQATRASGENFHRRQGLLPTYMVFSPVVARGCTSSLGSWTQWFSLDWFSPSRTTSVAVVAPPFGSSLGSSLVASTATLRLQ